MRRARRRHRPPPTLKTREGRRESGEGRRQRETSECLCKVRFGRRAMAPCSHVNDAVHRLATIAVDAATCGRRGRGRRAAADMLNPIICWCAEWSAIQKIVVPSQKFAYHSRDENTRANCRTLVHAACGQVWPSLGKRRANEGVRGCWGSAHVPGQGQGRGRSHITHHSPIFPPYASCAWKSSEFTGCSHGCMTTAYR